jgi:hypothetical protein
MENQASVVRRLLDRRYTTVFLVSRWSWYLALVLNILVLRRESLNIDQRGKGGGGCETSVSSYKNQL